MKFFKHFVLEGHCKKNNFCSNALVFLLIFLNLFCFSKKAFADTADQIYAKGYGLFVRDNLDSAQNVFENAIAENSNFAPFYDGLADVYLKKNNFSKSVYFYKIASAKAPDNNIYKIHMYNALYLSALQRINKTADDFNAAIKLQVTNSVIVDNISKVHEGKYKDLKLITDFYTDDKDENLTKGNVARTNGNFEISLKYYLDSAIKSSSKYKSYNNIGLIYLDKNDTQNALFYFKKAAQESPKSAYAYNNTGVVYLSKKDYQNAGKSFDDALKNYPNYLSAYNNRAVTAIRQTMADAQVYANSLLNLLKKDLENVALVKAAAKYQDLSENPQKAADLFKPVLEKIANNSEMLSNYGLYLFKSGNYSEAEEKIKKSIALYPANENNYLLLARIYEKTNQSNKAAENYEKAISKKTDFADAFYYYGQFLLAQGNSKESKKYFKKYIDLSQEQPYSYIIKYSIEKKI